MKCPALGKYKSGRSRLQLLPRVTLALESFEVWYPKYPCSSFPTNQSRLHEDRGNLPRLLILLILRLDDPQKRRLDIATATSASKRLKTFLITASRLWGHHLSTRRQTSTTTTERAGLLSKYGASTLVFYSYPPLSVFSPHLCTNLFPRRRWHSIHLLQWVSVRVISP